MDTDTERREWIIQRCTQVWIATELQYDDWPGYAEHLMTRSEMLSALQECEGQWPQYEFRGHNLVNQPRPSPKTSRGRSYSQRRSDGEAGTMHQSTHSVAFLNGAKSQTHTLPNISNRKT